MTLQSDHQTSCEILARLGDIGDSVRIRKLLKMLGLSVDARRRIRRLLKALVQEGKVISEGRGRYRIAATRSEVEGLVVSQLKGWILVVPSQGDAESLRVHPGDRSGALPGDCVRAMVARRRPGGLNEGRVIEILKRGGLPFAGVYQERPGDCLVLPDDPEIAESVHVDPVRLPGLQDGVVVVVQVDDPQPRLRPHGRILKVLGEPGELACELGRVVLEHRVQESFPQEVEDEAAGIEPSGDDLARVDLRSLAHVTIDPRDARDHDDAVFVEPRGQGHRLLVSIADVASVVPPGGRVDSEARARGCSVYLPSRVYSMLPRRITEDLSSLSEGQDRAAVSVDLDIDSRGLVKSVRCYRSLIRSQARLTYQEVQAELDGSGSEKTARHGDQIRLLQACARRMLARMSDRGVLDLDLPDQEIRLGEDGRAERIRPAVRLFAHRIIEVFMIAANEAIASLLVEAQAPAVYRVHPPPDPEKIETFSQVAENLGAPVNFDSGVPSPKQVAAYLHSIQDRPVAPALNQLLLRSFMQARYAPECHGHYGLASSRYLHFTSPIRRYPDLMVHRQLGVLLQKAGKQGIASEGHRPGDDPRGSPDWSFDDKEAASVSDLSSLAERRALEAERAVSALYQADFMKEQLGEWLDGTVAFVMDFGVFVRMHPSGVEGLVHISRMREDDFRYNQLNMTLVGRRSGQSFRIGMKVRVRVESVSLARRQIDLSFTPEG